LHPGRRRPRSPPWRRTAADALLEGKVDHVIGIDAHRDTHAAAILDRNGGLVAELEVPSDQAGGQALLRFVTERARQGAAAGRWRDRLLRRRAGQLSGRPGRVGSRDRPAQAAAGPYRRQERPLDAIRAGREALSREHLATPRQRGQREALRVLQLTRAGVVKVSADARRHLKALLVTGPEPLRAGLRGGPGSGRPKRARH
jgi:transposase